MRRSGLICLARSSRTGLDIDRKSGSAGMPRSEERFSRNAETDLVCRLLLEKKKKQQSYLRRGAVSSRSGEGKISKAQRLEDAVRVIPFRIKTLVYSGVVVSI